MCVLAEKRKKKVPMLTSCFSHVGLFTLLSYFYTQNSDTSYLQGGKNRPQVQGGILATRLEKRRWVYWPPDLWGYETDIKIVGVGQAVSSNRCRPAQTQYGRPVLLGGRLDRLENKELTRHIPCLKINHPKIKLVYYFLYTCSALD